MILTFYSFKGGVGRTMALANIAVALAERGKSVLTIDFDLEAPGLTRYLQQLSSDPLDERPGVLDLLEASAVDAGAADEWPAQVVELESGRDRGRLGLLTCGRQDREYAARVLSFDWSAFFRDHGGGEIVERLRSQWADEFDVVLVDSRTGITDSGGVCTIQLPDVLVPVFTANEQSLHGAVEVVGRAQAARRKLAHERGEALVFPLPSRFDDRTESELARTWMSTFSQELGTFYETWLPTHVRPRQVLERTKLPYVPYYSFGEPLPVRRDSPSDVGSLGFALRTAARLIEQRFEDVDSLLGTSAPPTATAGTVDQFLDSVPADLRRRMLNVIVRLAVAVIEGLGLPVELIDDDEAITGLLDGGMCEIQNQRLVLADAAFVNASAVQREIAANTELLDWIRTVIQSAQDRFDLVLEGSLLAEGLRWRADAGPLLTPFELDLVDLSVHRGEARRRRAAREAVLLRFGAVTSVGALAGATLALLVGLAPVPVIGLSLGLGGLLAALFNLPLARLGAQETVPLDTADSWSSRRRCALELADLGYEASGLGRVMVFEHTNRARLPIVLRLAAWLTPSSALQVIVQSQDDPAELVAQGPGFALRRLQRVGRRA